MTDEQRPTREGSWGINGYPQIVPGTGWAAQTVCRNMEPFYTATYHFQDDPLFEFRTVGDSPWFTKAQCETINAPHRKNFWRKEERTFALDPAAWSARETAWQLLRRETVYRRRHEQPLMAFETVIGGWWPSCGADARGEFSQTAKDVAYRARLRAEGKFQEADLVRRVIEGGSIGLADEPAGTLWFFPEGSPG